MVVFNGEKRENPTREGNQISHSWPSKDTKDFSQYIPGANKTLKYQAKRVTNDAEKA